MTPTPALPMWLEVLKAVAPLIAALLAAGVGAYVAHKFGTIQAGIARQQAETAKAAAATAKNKLKLELFERRMEVYECAQNALRIASQTGDLANPDEMQYLAGIQGARWLFGDDVNDYLSSKLWRMLYTLHHTFIEIGDASQHEKKELTDKHRQAMLEILNQRKEIDRVFAPYLQIES
jgi:hypothetical protein